ncbi:AFR092Wp [Eremothecium gossypii ATCC 10895]|uniref:AFR092Wp n=1 Tax=Eremothecium gossypii (strain ATCC 10895 / CBS 109.51 / FGSC 9923 / NRRL Y-1056) TaxID=284811 RepID=Q754I4_EREGS|nr:AFR092Wp [Eremothecium gossypii ATCC 10895]AAS53463.1 AFR092Wp [Eremothecium gossypii ATCC 10895]
MAFLKRLNVSSHSRSSSGSSGRTPQNTSGGSKATAVKPLPQIPVEMGGIESEVIKNGEGGQSVVILCDDVGSGSYTSVLLSPSDPHMFSADGQRLSVEEQAEKTLYSWDVTDPEQWTMQRVMSWFKAHDFDEQWILFFKRNHISGKKFLQLLAHDNFNKYESFLSATKNSSYNRFQHLLKRTLEENVSNSHRRQRSNKSNDSKGSADCSLRYRRRRSVASEQRTLTAAEGVTPRKTVEVADDRAGSSKNHRKAKSASVLYRRSFISLRSSSSSNIKNDVDDDCKTLPAMKISIPPRPFSSIERSTSSSPASTLKSQSSPLSPGNHNMFRKDHKSSSSDSSLFNNLFGSADEITKAVGGTAPQGEQIAVKKYNDTLPSPMRVSPRHIDDKSTIWDKLKKRALPSTEQYTPSRIKQLTSGRNSSYIQTLQESPDECSANNEDPPATATLEAPIIDDLVLEEKHYPSQKQDSSAQYVLVTKDNRIFLPLNIAPYKTTQELKDGMTAFLGISSKAYTIHLTDLGCDPGVSLSDDVIAAIGQRKLNTRHLKFYVKDATRMHLRLKNDSFTSDHNITTEMSRSKGSLRSAASSFISSNDDTNSFSDITSIDEHGNITGRRVYPQTPSHYYDQSAATHSPEVDYWNIKERLSEGTSPMNISLLRSTTKAASLPSSIDEIKKSSFKVIRKASVTDIDFNKGRESPYIRPKLAPKREAPRPPRTSSQVSLASSSSIQSSLVEQKSISNSPTKPQRQHAGTYVKNKTRPPPPPSIGSTMTVDTKVMTSVSDSPVSNEPPNRPYGPFSTQKLVPQGFKGVGVHPGTRKVEEQMHTNPVTQYIQKQRSRNSISKMGNNPSLYSPPRLKKRISTRRMVSSTSAADIFDENEISFADAPDLSDYDSENSESSDDIIWSTTNTTSLDASKISVSDSTTGDDSNFSVASSVELQSSIKNDAKTSEDSIVDSIKEEGDSVCNLVGRKMTLRPTTEVVYQNLEMFFPGTDLDKPILEGLTPPASPDSEANKMPDQDLTPLSKVSTISSESSMRQSTPRLLITKKSDSPQPMPVRNLKPPKRTKTIRSIAREASEARKKSLYNNLKRQNTKMWGTRVVEVTDKRMVSINKSKNSKGEYREFAWIKGEMIGKGSFGAVYLGLNVTTGEMMAVKQVEVPKFGSQDETTVNNAEALISEVSTLKDLDHLNIVQYLGFENKNCIYSLFLEYVAGGSVGSLIRLYGHFDEQLIRFLTTQVLEGLAYLHLRGILHRDMKADNLLLDNDGVCKISDFGISRKSNNIYSNSEMTMRGTVFWMAPEMVDTTQGYSAKVDIWSLGCVVLEMFAGKRPWSNLEVVAAMFQIGKSKSAPPIPEDTLPHISQDGRAFLDDCFMIDPEERPTADTLLSHPFCQVPKEFNFRDTDLYNFIKQNDKLNNSKLTRNSQR